MSDYTKTTNFTAKDSLAPGDPLKLIKGSYFDTEFDAIAVASATKYDSGNLSTQAQAEALTLDTVLITPHTLNDVLVDNDGILKDLQAITGTGADGLFAYDFGTTAAKVFTLGTGLTFSGDTVILSFLGIEALVDPNADSILAWDDVAGAAAWFTAAEGLEFVNAASTISLIDVVAGAAQPVVITDGTFTFDLSSITEIDAVGLDQTADGFLISDAGVPKVMNYDEAGFKVLLAETTGSLAKTDANAIMEFNATATLTIPVEATHDFVAGSGVILCMDHATQVLTVTAAATVVLNSVFHPGGGTAASDTVNPGGMAVLLYLGAEEWYLTGDIST